MAVTSAVKFAIGDELLVTTASAGEQRGTVLFVGKTSFDTVGEWIGLELQNPVGKHDGAVKGTTYFKCKMLHGVFVRHQNVLEIFAKAKSPADGGGKVALESKTTAAPRDNLERKASGGADAFFVAFDGKESKAKKPELAKRPARVPVRADSALLSWLAPTTFALFQAALKPKAEPVRGLRNLGVLSK